MDLSEAKDRLRIPEVWRRLALPGEPKLSCRCPFHDDRQASFSIAKDGLLWNCFAGCGGGDAADFLRLATGLSSQAACKAFIEMAGGVASCPPPVQKSLCFKYFSHALSIDQIHDQVRAAF